jgi:hypothetical protein
MIENQYDIDDRYCHRYLFKSNPIRLENLSRNFEYSLTRKLLFSFVSFSVPCYSSLNPFRLHFSYISVTFRILKPIQNVRARLETLSRNFEYSLTCKLLFSFVSFSVPCYSSLNPFRLHFSYISATFRILKPIQSVRARKEDKQIDKQTKKRRMTHMQRRKRHRKGGKVVINDTERDQILPIF